MLPTNLIDPAHFHKVVDCQWACPAHTPVPEYIRLIAQGRHDDAYMVNWVSNVFPAGRGAGGAVRSRPATRHRAVPKSRAPPFATAARGSVGVAPGGDVAAESPME